MLNGGSLVKSVYCIAANRNYSLVKPVYFIIAANRNYSLVKPVYFIIAANRNIDATANWNYLLVKSE